MNRDHDRYDGVEGAGPMTNWFFLFVSSAGNQGTVSGTAGKMTAISMAREEIATITEELAVAKAIK